MNTIFKGLKSLVLKPSIVKLILFIIVIIFMYKTSQDNSQNIVKYFSFYLAIPGYLWVLGMITKEPEQKESVKNNSLSLPVQKNNIPENENNNVEIVEKLEKRTITTSKQETIETVYFKNGKSFYDAQTYFFNDNN